MAKPKYSHLVYCSLCGQDEGWYEKIGDGYGQTCPVHGYKMRTSTRLTRIKKEERWSRAY